MIFEVERASLFFDDDDTPPCEGAVLRRGRYENGAEWTRWEIEISDLAALMDFCRSVRSDLIISDADNRAPVTDGRLKIYDDYIE